jgi:hypothetical protein
MHRRCYPALLLVSTMATYAAVALGASLALIAATPALTNSASGSLVDRIRNSPAMTASPEASALDIEKRLRASRYEGLKALHEKPEQIPAPGATVKNGDPSILRRVEFTIGLFMARARLVISGNEHTISNGKCWFVSNSPWSVRADSCVTITYQEGNDKLISEVHWLTGGWYRYLLAKDNIASAQILSAGIREEGTWTIQEPEQGSWQVAVLHGSGGYGNDSAFPITRAAAKSATTTQSDPAL